MINNFCEKINIKKINLNDSSLYVTDIFDRTWKYDKYEDVKEEAYKISRNRFFHHHNYSISSSYTDFYNKSFNSLEKVQFPFFEDDIFETGLNLCVLVEGGWVYKHIKTFSTYTQIVEIAKRIEERGIVNLNYWTVHGAPAEDGRCSTNIEELESYNIYRDHDYNYNNNHDDDSFYLSLASEEDICNQRDVYLSNGMWLKPDGSTEQK